MDLAVSAQVLVWSLIGVLVFVIGLILVMRYVFSKRSQELLEGKRQHKPSGSPLEEHAKYSEVDTFSLSGTFFNFGMLAALGLTILAFSWTTYEKKVDISQYLDTLEEDIEVEPPRTAEPPPPPPPPPPPVIEEVPEELIEEEDDVEFVDQSVEDETVIERPEPVVDAPPPPPPPPPPKKEPDEIFKVVEEMPTFPGCESISDKVERKKCVDKKLLEFIYSNIKYPAIARENSVEGMVVITFVVEKDGSITDARIARDIGAGCGQEALRVVKMMPKWNPGKQRGRPVRVQFNLPIRFKLE